MDVYMYNAALHCEDCGEKIKADLDRQGKAPVDSGDESTFDSDDYPKGPIPDGGGEADSPGACDTCGCFLENPLTADGMAYVHSAILEKLFTGQGECAEEWAEFYDISLADLFEHASKTVQDRRRERERVTLDQGRDALRRDYHGDIRRIADDFRDEAKKGTFADADEADTWLHETIDGCQRVIYTQEAQEALLCSSNDDAYFQDFGSEGVVSDGCVNWSALAYATVMADVREQLDAYGVDPQDPETWEPEEAASE